ncbi:hypothetical protein LZC95_19560 [Pendulispora brunnea]|uniref:Uncharacterized protein n=1 Tax=Pendulispora brunnea TaxID=2905690 RepID=A0ABZ2KPL8_9BACT
MPVLRPVTHLESVSRDYPGVWRQYAELIAQRRQLGDWPSWCYCPMAAAYACVSGGGSNRVGLGESGEIARVAALAAGRPTQGIYRFHPEMLSALRQTELTGDLPASHLHRLPEWCVYIELDMPSLVGHLHGFFAHLEHDANDGRSELRLLLDTDAGLAAIPVHLGGTLEESIAGFFEEANRVRENLLPDVPSSLTSPPPQGEMISFGSQVVQPLIAVLLYLCVGDAETRPTRNRRSVHGHPGIKRDKKGPVQPPGIPEVWETGFRLGAAMVRARDTYAAGETGRTLRPHIRKMHYHNFWIGSGESRRLDLRWMPPIPVNMEMPDSPTILNVDERSRK